MTLIHTLHRIPIHQVGFESFVSLFNAFYVLMVTPRFGESEPQKFNTVFQLGVAMRSNKIRTVNSNLASLLLVSVFALNGNACCFAQEEAGGQELGQGQSTPQEAGHAEFRRNSGRGH